MSLPYLRPELAAFTAYSPHAEDSQGELREFDQLDTNECPYDLPVPLKEKLAWLYQQEIRANRYPDGSHGSLKAAIADYVSEALTAQTAVTADHITVGNGSDELIRSILIAACLGNHGSVLVANPTFSMYAILAKTLGIPVIVTERDPETFALDLPTATQAIAEASQPVRVVFMVHPNSPTANALTAAELDWLKQLPETTLVVIDEAYFEFSQQTTVAECLSHSNWIVLRTFSKAFRLAAHRVGYGIACPELIWALEKVRLPYNLPSLSQAIARLALDHRQELLARVPEILSERQLLTAAIQVLGANLQVWPSQANFLYLRPQVGNGDAQHQLQSLHRHLARMGTRVRQTGGGLRITIGTPAENQRTLAHLKSALAMTAP